MNARTQPTLASKGANLALPSLGLQMPLEAVFEGVHAPPGEPV